MTTSTLLSYLELCKPRIVALMLITSSVGALLAPESGSIWQALVYGNIGIGLCAGAAATINHVIDQKIDTLMRRTRNRPLVSKRVRTSSALVLAALMTFVGTTVLITMVNNKTAILTLISLAGYAIIYTSFLKRVTTQNIVIGGMAGAMPPMLGWVAVTDNVGAHGWLLVLIIFLWTPPHFWSLVIAKREEYAKTNIPMFSVVYGNGLTSLHVFLYTVLLVLASFLPYLTGLSGLVYLILSALLNIRFLYLGWKLWGNPEDLALAMRVFWYSIYYLTLLFMALLLDKYWKFIW